MKSSSRTILSRFALLATIAASPLLMTDAQAFGGKPGGPFSNGTYFPNDGTFSAVLRGTDLVGTLQFSTGSTGSSGTAVIYSDGDQYFGNSSGIFNPSAKEIAIQFQADIPEQGQNTYTLRTIAETIQVDYFDSSYCDGNAVCKTSNDFPNQKFSGSGKASFQKLEFNGTTPITGANTPVLAKTSKNITVTGVRLTNTASAFASSTVTPPSVNIYTTVAP